MFVFKPVEIFSFDTTAGIKWEGKRPVNFQHGRRYKQLFLAMLQIICTNVRRYRNRQLQPNKEILVFIFVCLGFVFVDILKDAPGHITRELQFTIFCVEIRKFTFLISAWYWLLQQESRAALRNFDQLTVYLVFKYTTLCNVYCLTTTYSSRWFVHVVQWFILELWFARQTVVTGMCTVLSSPLCDKLWENRGCFTVVNSKPRPVDSYAVIVTTLSVVIAKWALSCWAFVGKLSDYILKCQTSFVTVLFGSWVQLNLCYKHHKRHKFWISKYGWKKQVFQTKLDKLQSFPLFF